MFNRYISYKTFRMKRALLLIVFSITLLVPSQAQQQINWNILTDVDIHKVFDASLGVDIYEADYKSAAPYEGQEVSVQGFIIPLDALGTQYVLSQNPQTSCFFCGGAGPETIIKLALKPVAFKRYATDTRMTFKGILKLNPDTREDMLYVLEQAEPF